MFQKKKPVFHLEPEEKRRAKKEKRILRWIFISVFLVSAVAIFFTLKHIGFDLKNLFVPSGKEEVTTTAPPQEVEAPLPDVSGKTNFLLVGKSDGGTYERFFILIQCDLDAKNFKVCGLPPNTLLSSGGKQQTLSASFKSGGGKQAAQAITDGLGIPIDRTAAVTESNFKQAGQSLGNITFTMPADIRYSTEDLSVRFRKGEQTLTADQVLSLLRYGNEVSKDLTLGNDLIAQCLDQLINTENVLKGEDLFRVLVNLAETDISIADFNNAQDALQVFARIRPKTPSQTFTIKGSAGQGGQFTISDASKKEAVALFQK